MYLHLNVHQKTVAAAAAAADDAVVVVAMLTVNMIEKDIDVHALIQSVVMKSVFPLTNDMLLVIDLCDHNLLLPIVLSIFSLTSLHDLDHYDVLNSN